MKSVAFYYWKPTPLAKPLPPSTTLSGFIHQAMFKWAGYNRYGLFHDDVLYEFPDVKEAIRRLPVEIYDQRMFRLVRAVQLDIQRIRLPPDQWTRYEDDQTIGRYLTPFLEDVRKEIKEQDAWIAEH